MGCLFNGGYELALVEKGFINGSMAAFSKEGFCGESIGGFDKFSVTELSDFDWFIWFGLVLVSSSLAIRIPVGRIAGCNCRLCIAREIAHDM
jgi:hypothetical protein